MKKTTGELLENLKSSKSYDDFFSKEKEELYFESLSQYLEIMMAQKSLSKSDVIRRSNMDKNYAYQIFNGTKLNPSRDKVIMLAFGLGLNAEEAEKLLRIAQVNVLYVRDPRDSLIIYCLEHSMTLMQANEKLDELKIRILE